MLPRPDALVRFHDAQLRIKRRWIALPAVGELMRAIAANHRYNQLLWRTEDQARRNDVPDRYIVQCKRDIDRYNQWRNDAVEHIDDALLAHFSQVTSRPGARLHSETAGSMVDRLSILALKIFHMRVQMQRYAIDADTDQRACCREKLHALQRQRGDLATCLAQLLTDIEHGQVYLKPYRQFKMYNDPRLNPWLGSRTGVLSSGSGNVPLQ